MTDWFENAALILADYYLAGTFLLIATLIGVRLISQPIRRMAACWAAMAALTLLIPATLLPAWPRVPWESLYGTSTDGAGKTEPLAGRASDIAVPAAPELLPPRDEQAAALPQGPGQEWPPGAEISAPGDEQVAIAGQSAWLRQGALAADSVVTASASPASVESSYNWPAVPGTLFVFGSVLSLAWLIGGAVMAQRLRRRCSPAPNAVQSQLALLVGDESKAPPVLVHDKINTAVALSALHPAIVLPERFVSRAPADELNFALAHEWAHIRNRDLWLLNTGRLLLVVLYAHPLFWWLRRIIRDNQELLADAYAAKETERHQYAHALLNLARLGIEGPVPRFAAVGIWERSSQLTKRIKTLLDERFTVKLNCSRGFRAATFACAIGLAVVCSLLTLRAPGESVAVADAVATDSDEAIEEPRDEWTLAPIGGILEDRRQRPVEGAQVVLWVRWQTTQSEWRDGGDQHNLATTVTDDQGRFRFENVKVSPELLASTFATTLQSLPLSVIATAPGQGTVWQHVSTRDTDLRMTMHAEGGVLGRLVDDSGAPLANADVRVSHLIEMGQLARRDKNHYTGPKSQSPGYIDLRRANVPLATKTDAKGYFKIDRLPRKYAATLLIDDDRYITTEVYAATSPKLTPDLTYFHDHPLHERGFTATVNRGVLVRGRVVEAETGKAIAGALVAGPVIIEPGWRAFWSGGQVSHPADVRTDQEGRFVLRRISHKELPVTVIPPDDSSYLRESISVDATGADQELEVTFELKRGVLVSGRVVDDKTGAGIAGAKIVSRGAPRVTRRVINGPDGEKTTVNEVSAVPSNRATTDDDGRFQIAVPPGTGMLKLFGNLPDYIVPSAPDNSVGEDDAQFARAFTATDQASPPDVEFRLTPAPTFTGQVLDPDGNPVAATRIHAQATTELEAGFAPAGQNPAIAKTYSRLIRKSWTTDADGRFTMTGLLNRDAVQQPAKTKIQAVFINPQRELAVVLDLTPPDASKTPDPITVRLERTGRMAGRIIDTEDRPMSRAIVSAAAIRLQGMSRLTTRSAADGTYSLSPLIPGVDYQLQVELPGYAAAKQELMQVSAGAARQIDVPLTKAAGIIAGVVVDKNGKPLAGVRVHGRFGRDRTYQQSATVTTDEMGRFELKGLLPGQGQIAMRFGKSTLYSREIINVGRRDVQLIFDPEPPAEKEVTETGPATLGPATPLAANTSTKQKSEETDEEDTTDKKASKVAEQQTHVDLTGRVVDAAGAPVEGAEVRPLFYEAPEPVTTGADGRFQFEVPLAAVRGRLALQALYDQGTQQAYYAYPTDFKLSEVPEGVDLVLQPAREIVVTVVDAKGAPVEEADVALTSSFRNLDFAISRNGTATLRIPHDVPIGNVWAGKSGVGLDYFVFRRPGQPESDPYQLPQDHSAPLTLTLNGAQTVTLRVVDGHDKPLSGIKVYPWYFEKPNKGTHLNIGGSPEFTAQTDDKGRVTFATVPADNTGKITFWAREKGYFSPKRPIYDPQEPVDEVVAQLIAQVPVRGSVQLPDGRPAADMQIIAFGAGHQIDGFHGGTKTDDEGRFAILVNPDQYCVFVAGDNEWATKPHMQIIRQDTPVEGVELDLQPATRVYGQVTIGNSNEPFVDQYISLYQRDGSDAYYKLPENERLPNPDESRSAVSPMIVRNFKTDAQGRFEFFVGPGSYYIIGPSNSERPQFKIGDEKQHEVNLHSRRPDTVKVTGRVVLRDKREVGVAKATVDGAPSDFYLRYLKAVADANGRFEGIRGAGEMTVFARSEDHKLAGLIKIGPDEKVLVIPVGPLASAEGRVIDEESGEPASDREVRFSIQIDGKDGTFQNLFGGSATTDDNGEFLIAGLVPEWEYRLTVVVERDKDGRARSWRQIGKVTAPDTGQVALGDLILEAPYRPKTFDEKVTNWFDNDDPADERFRGKLRDARLSYQRLLMVIGTPAENATRVFFDLFYDLANRDVRMALENHLIWAVDTGTAERAKTARPLAEGLGISWPDKEKLTLAVVDMDGKLLAQRSLDAFLVDGKVERAKLITFLNEYRQELPDAQKILNDAFAEAKRDNKRVFVQESGPYCGPCVLLSRFIEKHRELFNKDYVYVKLDRRFAHGKEIIDELCEEGQGIPWSVILDAEGNALINSNGPDGNIGYPSTEQGIVHFQKMLTNTARHMTAKELQSLIDDLESK